MHLLLLLLYGIICHGIFHILFDIFFGEKQLNMIREITDWVRSIWVLDFALSLVRTWINLVQLGLATVRCALPLLSLLLLLLLLRTALAELPLITETFCEHLNKRSTTAFLPLWRFGKLARNHLRSTSKAPDKSYVPHTHTRTQATCASRPQTAPQSNRCVRVCLCMCDTFCRNIFRENAIFSFLFLIRFCLFSGSQLSAS